MILLAIFLVLWKIPSSPRSTPSTKDSTPLNSPSSKVARVDFLGAALLASSITAFLLFLELSGKTFPWNSQATYLLGGASIALCASFAWVEQYWAIQPIFPLRLLGNRDVVTSYLIAALQIAAQLGVSTFLVSLLYLSLNAEMGY